MIQGKHTALLMWLPSTTAFLMPVTAMPMHQPLLVNSGANGGIAKEDVRITFRTMHSDDIQSIDNHQAVTNILIIKAGSVVKSQHGDVIAIILHQQYTYAGCGRTIHSSGQLEWYQNDVNDRSIKVQGSLQRITTLDRYAHPINIVSGLPYITMRPYTTDDKWDTLPHDIWTGDTDWDPPILDHTLDNNDNWWFDAIFNLEARPFTNLFDKVGNN
jgi:hypothetical protein